MPWYERRLYSIYKKLMHGYYGIDRTLDYLEEKRDYSKLSWDLRDKMA